MQTIGTSGIPWGLTEKSLWLANQSVKRSYETNVLAKIESFKQSDYFDVHQYGILKLDKDCDNYKDSSSVKKEGYPLYAVTTKNWSKSKNTVLVTGGKLYTLTKLNLPAFFYSILLFFLFYCLDRSTWL